MAINSARHAFHNITSKDWIQWIVRQRFAVLFTIGMLTVFFLFFIPRMVFNTSVHDMVIENLEETRQYEDFKKIFGSGEIIRVVVTGDDVFSPAAFAKMERLKESLKNIDGVQRTISLPDVKEAVDLSGTWPMETFQSRIESVPLMRRNLISEDHTTTVVTLVLENGTDHARMIGQVQKVIDAEGTDLTLYQMGMPVISDALARFTKKDFFRLPPIIFAMVALLLFLFLKHFHDVILPLLCVTLTVIWTLGIVTITGMDLSILTMIVPVFLIAVGTAYCLHIICEYRHQLQTHDTPESAVVATYSVIVLPTLLASGTTILGVGSLYVSRISSIQSFAVICCSGMASFVIMALTFLPAALSLFALKKRNDQKAPWLSGMVNRIIDGIISLNVKYRKISLPVLFSLILLGLIGMFRLEVETNPVDYLKPGSQVRTNFDNIHQQLSGSLPINIVMEGHEEEYFQTIEGIETLGRFQGYVQTLPEVDKAVSFAEYLKLVNYASNRYEPENYRLPTESFEVRMLVNSYRTMLGREMLDAFISPDGRKTNIMLFTHISSSKTILQLKEKILSHVATGYPAQIQWDVTGFGVAIAASSSELTKGQIKSLILTMGIVFGIMFMLFLSWKVGMVAIVTNLFPIIMNFGIMGWAGIELSIATSLIASIAIGLAVDDTIHYLVRFNREFKKDLDSDRALKTTLKHIGRPILYTTVTIGLGFSVLLFSEFKPTAIFGAMMAITVFAALLGDLVLLPSFMQRMELVTLWDLVGIRMGKEPNLEIPLFHGFTRAEAQSIFMAGALRKIGANEVLFEKGTLSDAMYAVISGRFEVIDFESQAPMDQSGVHGVQKHIRYAEKGDLVGEMGMLRSMPRSATVVAVETGELLPINWKIIQRMQWLYPPTALKFMHNLIRILCDRIEATTHCMADGSFMDDLTRLSNKKGLCKIIELEMNRALRTGQALILWQLDVLFCRANDKETDAILQRLGMRLSECIRGSDTLSRIDAHRFVLLTGAENGEKPEPLKKRMQEAIQKVQVDFGEERFTVQITSVDVPLNKNANGEEILECTLHCVP